MNVKIKLADLSDLLSFCPNLKMMFLYFVNQNAHNEVLNVQRFYDDPLPEIKDIVIYECGDSVLGILSQLPKDSVKSLTIKIEKSFEALKDSLPQQRTIKKLNLISDSNEDLTGDFFENLPQLTHLTLNLKQKENLPAIIACNRGLTALDIGDMEIDDIVFMEVVQLPLLEKLIIDCSAVSVATFISLESVKGLKFLSVISISPTHFEVLATIKSSIFGKQPLLKNHGIHL